MIILSILLCIVLLPVGLIGIGIGLLEFFGQKSLKKKIAAIKREKEVFYAEHSVTVYCPNKGNKFHSPSCRYDSGSIMIAADALLMGKEPCSICNPEKE